MEFYDGNNLDHGLAQVAIPHYVLEKLLAMKAIHYNECKCLNSVAKNIIWQTLLQSSVKVEN